MPELPEAQTIVNELVSEIIGKVILGIEVFDPKFVKQIKTSDIGKKIKGKSVIKVSRRGKAIIIELSQSFNLLIQLGMTGGLILLNPDQPQKYIRYQFLLSNSKVLGFRDMRKFGKIIGYHKEQPEFYPKFLKSLGPEPFSEDFSEKYLLLKKKNRSLSAKDFIMDQKMVAGVGNIYACEILYAAKINPKRKTATLKKKECKRIVQYTREILNRAIKRGGTTIRDYMRLDESYGEYKEKLLVYGRENEPCVKCSTLIKRIRQSNRSTFFCPCCQK